MHALKAHALLVWDLVQLLGYVGIAAAAVIGIPAMIVLGFVAAGWAHS